MASPKKRVNPLLIVLLAVLLAAAVAVGVVFAKLRSKVTALQSGASFTLRYEITPNSPQTPPLLSILNRVNASSGSVSGQYAPGRLQLSFYQLNADGSVKASPFTRVYIDAEETLFDVGQLYPLRRTGRLPLLSVPRRSRRHDPRAGLPDGQPLLGHHPCPHPADHPGAQRPHPAHRHRYRR